jgi:hypothetical protein
MNVATPIQCKCGAELKSSDEECASCGAVNPHFVRDVRTLVRRLESTPSNDSSLQPGAASLESTLQGLARELANAKLNGCKVIANVGLSEAGKSWLIARMSRLRPGTRRSTLYSEGKRPHQRVLESGDILPRTSRDEVYVWHLEPSDECEGRAIASGSWRIIDIAGELVSDPEFINNIVSGRPLYDLLTMTLAHASALVLVIDGEELAREEQDGEQRRGGATSVDEQNEGILNELVRLMRFLHHDSQGRPPADLEELRELKEKIRDNPTFEGTPHTMLAVPALLLVSKADALGTLGPGSCPLEFAEGRLRRTHVKALQNISVWRWAAAAPFVGQSLLKEEGRFAGGASAKQVLDFARQSFGVGQALEWLDSELGGLKRYTALTAQRALHRLERWNPLAARRKTLR